MNLAHHNLLLSVLLRAFADRPTGSVTDWVTSTVRFDEPNNRGPFKLTGREYAREILDASADLRITDEVIVSGSMIGKTSIIMAKACWALTHDPSRIFWVMPTRDLVRKFSRTRWIPMVKATLPAEMIPTGARRHDFATLEQQIGSSIVDMVWSNSAAALSSTPARMAILDEVDKFREETKSEANSLNLAEQRTKDAAMPKRLKTSTPTLADGPIWQELLKTDVRRRFVPCPHCHKLSVLAWSKDYTTFKLTGAEAFVVWDKEAKRDGGWDLDRVYRSAHYECPHCHGEILEGHKTLMDRHGEWRATQTGAATSRGWHLPSLYACRPETSCGKLAVKFLQQKQSLKGLRGFINSELAEPWENQESRSERVEIVSRGPEPIGDSPTLLGTVDYQFLSPHFWYVIRAWVPPGHSRLVAWGNTNGWEQVFEVMEKNAVTLNHVLIDSAHDSSTVYEHCLQHGKLVKLPGMMPIFRGWIPCRGREGSSMWPDKKTKTLAPYTMGSAPLGHRKFRLPLFEFNGEYIKDVLERLRTRKAMQRWELCDGVDDEYFKHLDAELKKPKWHPYTRRMTRAWQKRNRTWPDHLRDCEVEQIAWAMFHRLLVIEPPAHTAEGPKADA